MSPLRVVRFRHRSRVSDACSGPANHGNDLLGLPPLPPDAKGAHIVADLHYHLRGELDMSNADDLQEQLASASRGLRGGVVIDCAGLTYIDGYGLKALSAMQRAFAAEGRTFRVINASPTLHRNCDATGLTYLFRLDDAEPPVSEVVGG